MSVEKKTIRFTERFILSKKDKVSKLEKKYSDKSADNAYLSSFYFNSIW